MTDDMDDNDACLRIDPVGFHLKPSPPPHALTSFLTPDESLFETIHMGAAVVDETRWRLCIDGLVERPFRMDLAELRAMPAVEVTAFHECYGSPISPPLDKVMRMGNVRWQGVRVRELLQRAGLEQDAAYLWSFGLDAGEFGGRRLGRYQKAVPIYAGLPCPNRRRRSATAHARPQSSASAVGRSRLSVPTPLVTLSRRDFAIPEIPIRSSSHAGCFRWQAWRAEIIVDRRTPIGYLFEPARELREGLKP